MLIQKQYTVVAKTFHGLEQKLMLEMRDLGAVELRVGRRAVYAKANLETLYRLNLCSRLSLSFLITLNDFKAHNDEVLYKRIHQMPWESVIGLRQTIAVDATVHSNTFTHSQFVALRCKDAIVDRLREVSGGRPSVDRESPDLRITIHVADNAVSVGLDSSGDRLHKRGYRKHTGVAPINEVLAAGILSLAGWEGQMDFLDPMCGSGTLAVEALMMARNIPAGIFRAKYGFMEWPNFDSELWEKVKEQALSGEKEFPHRIYARDVDARVLEAAATNITAALLDDEIRLRRADFVGSSSDNPVFIVMNPPYNERLTVSEKQLYRSIGDTLKQGYAGSVAAVFSASVEGLKSLGLRPSKKFALYNGALPASLWLLEMYDGSRRQTGVQYKENNEG